MSMGIILCHLTYLHNYHYLTKPAPQVSQTYGLSRVCLERVWSINFCLVTKLLPHSLHKWSATPWWTFKWYAKPLSDCSSFGHIGHLKMIFSCFVKWYFSAELLLKILKHFSQAYSGLSECLLLICLSRFSFWTKDFVHWVQVYCLLLFLCTIRRCLMYFL